MGSKFKYGLRQKNIFCLFDPHPPLKATSFFPPYPPKKRKFLTTWRQPAITSIKISNLINGRRAIFVGDKCERFECVFVSEFSQAFIVNLPLFGGATHFFSSVSRRVWVLLFRSIRLQCANVFWAKILLIIFKHVQRVKISSKRGRRINTKLNLQKK